MGKINGWSKELEMELREILTIVERKDIKDYERLGNLALKINKTLVIVGPLLIGIAAIGSTFVGDWSSATMVTVMVRSLAAAVNAFEHSGQVSMVFEVYRNYSGFFKLLENPIESIFEEKDLERKENDELYEMKMAMKLGTSLLQLRELARKSACYHREGIAMDEFVSKPSKTKIIIHFK